MDSRFENLVLGGGGAAGALAHLGAIPTLMTMDKTLFDYSRIKRVAGTSVGAITALMVALGYTEEEFAHYVKYDLKLGSIADGGWWFQKLWRLANGKGIHKGDALRETIFAVFDELDLDLNMTFGELYEDYGKELHIAVTRMTEEDGNIEMEPIYFSHRNCADTPIWLIIMASAAAYPYFPPVRLKKVSDTQYRLANEDDNLTKHDLICIDGGFTKNLLVEHFDNCIYLEDAEQKAAADSEPQSYVNPATLAIAITEKKPSENPVKNPLKGFGPLNWLLAILGNNQHDTLKKRKNENRTILIPRCDIKLADFNTTHGPKIIAETKSAIHTFFDRKKRDKKESSSERKETSQTRTSIGRDERKLSDDFVSVRTDAPSLPEIKIAPDSPSRASPKPQIRFQSNSECKFSPPSAKKHIFGSFVASAGFATIAVYCTLLFLASHPVGWVLATALACTALLLATAIFAIKANNRRIKNAILSKHSPDLQQYLYKQNDKLKNLGIGKTTRHLMIKEAVIVNDEIPSLPLNYTSTRKLACEIVGKRTENKLYLNRNTGMLFFKKPKPLNRMGKSYQDTADFGTQLAEATSALALASPAA